MVWDARIDLRPAIGAASRLFEGSEKALSAVILRRGDDELVSAGCFVASFAPSLWVADRLWAKRTVLDETLKPLQLARNLGTRDASAWLEDRSRHDGEWGADIEVAGQTAAAEVFALAPA